MLLELAIILLPLVAGEPSTSKRNIHLYEETSQIQFRHHHQVLTSLEFAVIS